ncbi:MULTISPECIES: RNA polymerase-binding protein DksA [Erwiniaceae]|uniref:RNA polymerase-binding protein DksA n=1 Tax=Pantoea coffeiphila TaxID=1465635 RepID=A0A2S9I451_9GAMM|nr:MULTISPECIES: RNA polymerase-binding protein DksA [Erwiniaceae]MBK0002605.1 RNA polymerase-binding protein DksA [Erwinia sp. S38]MCW1876395.1 RNA polymerase-binding protein DksA [Erwinia sp. INIA01]PRD12572.1 RNA polymerase-binding protein DksA [Pantoea coffeiphila]
MSPADYMNAQQLAFFQQRLLQDKQDLLAHIDQLKASLQWGDNQGDEADKAMREEELRLLLRQIDRESRLLPKIDAALIRIRKGEYGYCQESGDPIGLPRLLLRPTAELSIDVKMTHEMKEAAWRK